ncbi:MAG TPA: hypothetical protein VG758_07215 [Hyphomicrobiaceae bacterium]|jgi:hypothetical protein|nr:hypothetical protein [Hyphomicrobiaceae bacterium]
MRIAAAAALYFAIVFSVGFLLGPIRVLWLEPRVGPVLAALSEAPFLLAAMVVAARWVPRVAKLQQSLMSLALTGVGALVLQQIADFAVGIGLRGMSPSEQLGNFATGPGMVYAALLVIFAVMPLLLNHRSPWR